MLISGLMRSLPSFFNEPALKYFLLLLNDYDVCPLSSMSPSAGEESCMRLEILLRVEMNKEREQVAHHSHQAHAKDDAAEEGQKLHKKEEQLVDKPILVGIHGLGNAETVVDEECQEKEHKAGEADQVEVAGPCGLRVHPCRGLKFHPNLGRGTPLGVCCLPVLDLTLHLDCSDTQGSGNEQHTWLGAPS